MREIKFRAINTRTNSFEYFRLPHHGNHIGMFNAQGVLGQLQQFTDLVDKNRKDIYEGDIVRIGELEDLEHDTDATVHVIKWFGEEGYPAFDLDGFESEANGLSEYAQGNVWNIEIIGNIYENPELLK